MFRRKSPPGTVNKTEGSLPEEPVQPPAFGASEPPLRSPLADKGPDMSTMKTPSAPTPAPSSFKPDIPRRVVDIPGAPAGRRPDAPAGLGAAPVPAAATDMRRLIVGRDISLSGEITACDVLVVEGTVEAKLRDGRNIEISESGLFKGSVEIDEADIAGRFEGDISVRGRLRLRASGKITGTIRYGELEVEAGGQLIGEIQVLGASVTKIPGADAAE